MNDGDTPAFGSTGFGVFDCHRLPSLPPAHPPDRTEDVDAPRTIENVNSNEKEEEQ
jgi:hypothetical protein